MKPPIITLTLLVLAALSLRAQDGAPPATALAAKVPEREWVPGENPTDARYLRQSPGGVTEGYRRNDYGLGPNFVDELEPSPKGGTGVRTPFDLWRYAGQAGSSFTTPTLPMEWDEWVAFHAKQKPELMRDVRVYRASRFDLSGEAIPGKTMSGGRKPVMAGPVAKLPPGVESFDALNELGATEIRDRDLFPYKPLAHPLQTTAHMVFPDSWIEAHPEHERIDVGHDFPDTYLPEFPPPLFLTTPKELGDVSGGR